MRQSLNQSWRFAGLLCVAGAIWFFARAPLGDLAAAFLAGTIAALLASLLQDGRWWVLIHAAFFPALILLLRLPVPPYVYFLLFASIWLVSGQALRQRVPLYATGRGALCALARCLPVRAKVLDVGAGTGTVLIALSRDRPDLTLAGAELAWGPWLVGFLRLPQQVQWLHCDYRELDFSTFDCVYAFLSPEPMPELWNKARQEMHAGSLFISNSFPVPGVPPDELIDYGDWKGGQLMLWRM